MVDSFEELGLAPETVEALSAEGIERPTALQSAAVPVIRRGNPFVAYSGPGAGTLVAFGAPLIDRLAEDPTGQSRVLVLSTDDEAAEASARSLARVAAPRGVEVAALVTSWAAPQDARVLFGTSARLFGEVQRSALSLDAFVAVVVSGRGALTDFSETAPLIELLPAGTQRIVMALPRDDSVDEFVRTYIRKALTFPPESPAESQPIGGSGVLGYRLAPEPRGQVLLDAVRTALESGTIRVAVHFRTDDQAADAGDLLELYGYPTGAINDDDVQVWLSPPGSDEPRSFSGLHAISFDVPADARALASRHGHAERSTVFLSVRELPHLRQIAAALGMRLEPVRAEPAASEAMTRLEERIEAAAGSARLAPYMLAAEKLAARYDPLEIAAAALSLALEGSPVAADEPVRDAVREAVRAPTRPVDAFVRLFLSVGSRDGVRAGDLLGAITGESGVEGSSIGKIEIRDSFSLIEVPGASADKVIRSLNGTSIRGRSVRADYDRQSVRRKRTR